MHTTDVHLDLNDICFAQTKVKKMF